LGGVDGKEGIVSRLLVKSPDKGWIDSTLNDIFLLEAVYVADKVIWACGSMKPKSSDPFEMKRDAVILYSSDGGQKWSISFHNKKTDKINSIYVNFNNVWAVGDKGAVLKMKQTISRNGVIH
jgi:hypothetical protein